MTSATVVHFENRESVQVEDFGDFDLAMPAFSTSRTACQ